MADHSLAGALAAGGAVALVALAGMLRHLHVAWTQHLRRFVIGARPDPPGATRKAQ